MEEKGMSFADAEKFDYPPFDHARIGGYITRKWEFSSSLIDTIQYHHSINTAANDLPLLVCIHFANIIAHLGADLESAIGKIRAICPEVWKLMEVCVMKIPKWLPGLEAEIQSASQFFNQEVV
jgi:hypothetical protein